MNTARTRRTERIFFLAAASFFLLANLIGFGSSVNARLENEGSLAGHIYIHGLCAGLWIILYFIQTTLVFSRKVNWHVRLGKAGVLVLLLVLLSGFYVAFMVPVLYNVEPPYSQPGRDFSAILLAVGTAFFGLKYRRKPFIHQRLMLIATLILSSAGIARAVNFLGLATLGPVGIISFLILPVIALFLVDYINQRRVFRVNFVGLLLVVSLFALSAPPVWENAILQPVMEVLVGWLS